MHFFAIRGGEEVVEIITSNIVLCWARISQVGVAEF